MKKYSKIIQLSILVILFVGTTINAQDGITWTSRTSAANNDWRSVTYGNGLFVAVSSTGTGDRVMTSLDGIIWTSRTSAADNPWSSVTYGNGRFVAVSWSGAVMTSHNGINWTSQISATNNNWNSVTYGNGLFVAVSSDGAGNRVMISPDGINWTSSNSAADNEWNSVTYGYGLFAAVSESGVGNRVMTSPDGITWTSQTSAADNAWLSVTYGNGLFVAVSATGTGDRVMTSPDGINWTSQTSAADNDWSSVTYGNGLFVAVSWSGAGDRVMTSPDGINWTSRTSAADNSWNSVTYGNGLFVAVSWSGAGDRVMTNGTLIIPQDGTTWTSRASAADNSWNSVTYGNGLFVAVSQSGGNRVMTSPDGISWTSQTSASADYWKSVTYGKGLFVAVSNTGTGNRVMTSPDGINWTSRTSAADNDWLSVTYGNGLGNGLFVAVSWIGAGDRVMTSPDGITWTSRTSASDNYWESVTYGNGLFVAVSVSGVGNRVMTSPDGITWTSRTSAADNRWSSVTYGNGLFVAVSATGTGDRVMTSPDGINWTSQTSAADNAWESVTYGNGLFVAVSFNGVGDRVMTSPDGINWTSRTSAADNEWNSVTYGNGLFVAVSQSGVGNRVMTNGNNISVTSPIGGESWGRSSSQNITWTSTGVTTVKIEYSTDNGSNYTTIVASTPAAAGTYAWTVPNTLTTQALIKISDAGNAAVNDVSDAVFDITIATWYVNTGTGSNNFAGTAASTPFATISFAVSSAITNDIISVASGTYPGDVTIDKNLIIVGTGAANSTANSFTINNGVVLGAGTNAGTTVTAPVVNVGGPNSKVQDGILLVSSGGTVNVASGTYNENIAIAKNLTLQASAAPYAIISPVAGDCITVNNNSTNVAIHGFDLNPVQGSFGIKNTTASTVDGTNNWWHTIDASLIPPKISNAPGDVLYNPYYGKPVNTNITYADLFHTLSFANINSSVTFTVLPTNTNATLTISQTPVIPTSLPALTGAVNLYLTITSTGLVNGTFWATIVLDVSNVAGFSSTSQVLFFNTTTNKWELTAGTYNGTAHTFTFETNHFTTFGFTGTNNTPYDITFGNIITNNTATISIPVKLNTNGNSGFDKFQAKFTFPGSKMNFLSGNIGTGTLMNTNGWITYFQAKAGVSIDTIMVVGVGLTSTTGSGQIFFKLKFKIIDPSAGSATILGNTANLYANGVNNVFFVGTSSITYTTGSSVARGDATLDGLITQEDVDAVIDHLGGSLLTGQSYINAAAADNDTTSLTLNDMAYIVYYLAHGTWVGAPGSMAPAAATVAFANAAQQSQGIYNLLNLPVNISAASKVVHNLEMIVTFDPTKLNYQSFRQDDATLVNGEVRGIIVDARDNVMATNLGSGKVRFLFASGDAQQNITPGKIIFNVIGTNAVITSEYKINSESTFHKGPSYGIATSLDNENIIPKEFSVSQNYPNPFNPSTIIKYALPQASFVSIKIYNILGQEVRTLINTEKSAGTYSVQWNGDNEFNHQVSSGTYIYRIVAGSNVSTKKMVLLK